MKQDLSDAIREVISNLDYPQISINIQIPKDPNHGDFSTNIAMQLAMQLKKKPIIIAEEIKSQLNANYSNLIKSIKIAGPGFINIFINKNIIVSQLKDVLNEKNNFGKSKLYKGKTAIIEFVSANPTGPLTVGHGRGAILGDVISNILYWNGYKIDKEYYYNNAGKQMKNLGESVKVRYLEILGINKPFPENGYEGNYIIEIAQDLYDKNNNSLMNIDDITIFKQAAEESIFNNIKDTLNKIGLQFDNYFNENTLYEKGKIEEVINKLDEKKLIYRKDGATWFKGTSVGRNQDRVIVKSSGEPTYRLPDIAYHLDKYNRDYDLIVDVLGADHMDAYPDVMAAIEQLNCDIEKMKVVIHQFVTLTENGKPAKMSTRKAKYITLNELVDEVGQDATRYFFIMRGINSHLNFDITLAKDESDNNPVYYLQYAYARLCNILKHAESLEYKIYADTDLSLLTLETEINLIKSILEFPSVIQNSAKQLEPQVIANYLQNLSSDFHKYYANERVVVDDKSITNARLILIKSLQIVIKNGLNILGINAPERM